MAARHHYAAALAILSVVLAIVLSLMALSLTFLMQDDAPLRPWRHHGSALLRGAANPVMHFTSMAAVSFTLAAEVPDLSHAVSIWSIGVLGISIVPVMVLVVALPSSLVDRFQRQRALLDELFEQAPQAVALMDADNRVVRVNREFTRLVWLHAARNPRAHLHEFIVPDESQAEEQRAADLVAHGQRVEVEGVRQRKAGSQLHVSIVHVPVSLPGGQIVVYGIYRDITERKRAEELLQTFSQRLIETQEAERRRIARELHDEIGQALTALKLNLEALVHAVNASPLVPRLQDSLGITDHALQQVRELALNLRPALLDDLGLVAALRWNGDQRGKAAHSVDVCVDGR